MDCKTAVLDNMANIRSYIEQCLSNTSVKDDYRQILEEHIQHRISNSEWLHSTLVGLNLIYILMICVGFTGNLLVIIVVVFNRTMRSSPRNLFILNLAVSDLILCVVTQPLNLYRILSFRQGWQLGLPMCKLTSMVQGTNVYVSSMSITAIALDRFRLIMNPARRDINVKTVYVILLLLWLLAFTLSTPVGVFATLSTDDGRPICSETTLNYTLRITKLVYSIVGMLLLYGTPVTLVSIAYAQICIVVNRRMKNKNNRKSPQIYASAITCPGTINITHSNNKNNREISGLQESSPNRPNPTERVSDVGPLCMYFMQRKNTAEDGATSGLMSRSETAPLRRPNRQRRTSLLLASVAIFFAISWLPLNIVNLILDLRELNFQVLSMNHSEIVNATTVSLAPMQSLSQSSQSTTAATLLQQSLYRGRLPDDHLSLSGDAILIIQAVCLLFVHISACVNPMLYGWLNENFRRSFKQLLRCQKKNTKTWTTCQDQNLVQQEKNEISPRAPKKRTSCALWPRAYSRKSTRPVSMSTAQMAATTYNLTSRRNSTPQLLSTSPVAGETLIPVQRPEGTGGLPRAVVLLETDIDAQ